jgi:hypothetical protein
MASFSGTLLHEITHARSGYSDVTREFEAALTEMLGAVAAAQTGRKPGSQGVSSAGRGVEKAKEMEPRPKRKSIFGSFFRR